METPSHQSTSAAAPPRAKYAQVGPPLNVAVDLGFARPKYIVEQYCRAQNGQGDPISPEMGVRIVQELHDALEHAKGVLDAYADDLIQLGQPYAIMKERAEARRILGLSEEMVASELRRYASDPSAPMSDMPREIAEGVEDLARLGQDLSTFWIEAVNDHKAMRRAAGTPVTMDEMAERLGLIRVSPPDVVARQLEAEETTQGGTLAPDIADTEAPDVITVHPSVYMIRFDGEEKPCTKSLGLEHIVKLIQRPHEDIDVVELDSGRNRDAWSSYAEQPVVDKEGTVALKAQFERLQSQQQDAIARSDEDEQARVAREIEAMGTQVCRDFKPDGKPRKMRDVQEASRTRVKNAIAKAMDDLATSHPTFYSHLKATIRTPGGQRPCYAPNPDRNWTVTASKP